jgi:poly-gamma-glutamate synthesis protein (capsule biosynthesis protein)
MSACAPLPRRASGGGLRVTLLGQSLIQHDLCQQDWPAMQALAARVSEADVSFSDLETAIRGPRAGPPTRDGITLHTANAAVIDCLKALGIDFLATSNNHAFDLGTGGIIDAFTAVQERGLVYAGSGLNLTQASRAGYRETSNGMVAVVACATGKVRDGGAATATRAGVAELRRDASGAFVPADLARTLAEIAAAAARADVVIAYQHNHDWEPENWVTPEWQRAFARSCFSAGASVFVGHGAPLLHGLELHDGRPAFYNLGSFIFQTKKEEEAYGPLAWQSLIAECQFRNGRFVEARLVPVQLNSVGVGGAKDLATRGRPALASAAEARIILERVAALSLRLGYQLRHDGRTALIVG